MRSDALNAALKSLALDLRFTWSHDAARLWSMVEPALWSETRNPWVVANAVGRTQLEALAANAKFCELLEACKRERDRAMTATSAFTKRADAGDLGLVAYFSMEFGLSEALPVYSGGLGVLAGDHLKAASDLGVPICGIGLLYGDGYFRQIIDRDGSQRELYPRSESDLLPIMPLRNEDGARVRIELAFPGRRLFVRAWEVIVGRSRLLLLDCNDPANSVADRAITNRLYGGGDEDRLRQEIVLGIGGRRVLAALGLRPDVCHMNEGHAAFAALEHAREIVEREHCDFSVALRAARAGTIFTTHTAVEAAFDRFHPQLVERYLGEYLKAAGSSIDELLSLGRLHRDNETEPFTMAYLAIRSSGRINAVSALHGEVSKELFAPLFPRYPVSDIPVEYVTNGVHVPTWSSEEAVALPAEPTDEQLWSMRQNGRSRLVEAVRRRLARRHHVLDSSPERLRDASEVLDPNALTIGFARRFATYKRPTLLLRRPERLLKLLNDAKRPIQLLIAGKAHPKDEPGKALVRQWVDFAERADVRRHVVFLEDYDLIVAHELTQGCDLWLNVPRRPLEASGTSGMKVLANGGLNFSELDGWWDEAFTPEVGWALGDRLIREDDPAVDEREVDELFALLERDIVPRFYDRDAQGIPRSWTSMMRSSIGALTERFSASRMVQEYAEHFYLPAARAYRERLANGAEQARRIELDLDILRAHWHEIGFGKFSAEDNGEKRKIRLELELGPIPPDHVCVELFADGNRETVELRRNGEGGMVFKTEMSAHRPISDYTARIVPAIGMTAVPLEMPLIAWQN